MSNLSSLPEATTAVTRAAHRMFAEFSCDMAFVLADDGLVLFANDGARQLLRPTSDLVGHPLQAFIEGGGTDELGEALAHARAGRIQESALHFSATDGEDVHVRARIFLDKVTNSLWFVGHNVSKSHTTERELRRMATHDALTGLPNRVLLRDRIEALISDAQQHQRMFATVAMDLDGFKKANDALGHLAGDQLLKEVANRLRACTREGDTVSRLGGDEFVLVLAELRSQQDALEVCQRALAAIRRPIEIQGKEVYVSASMGIALFPDHGNTSAELTQHADQAMYQAKYTGKNRLAFYEPELATTSTALMSLESAMHSAVRDGEFQVHFQPLVDREGSLKGCEALMRWRRSDGVWVPPAEFIPVAENNGLITLLGDYVLRSAVMQLRKLDEAGLPGLYVSANVSPRQLRHPDFEKNLKKALDISGIEPRRLVLEITESMLLSEQQRTQALLRKISATGVQFALDDFGTGYSCLAYLKTYPISALKIDKSFLEGIETEEAARAIVQAIIQLANALRLHTVVEGVETLEQARVLADMNVDYFQGFLYGKPMPSDEILKNFGPKAR